MINKYILTLIILIITAAVSMAEVSDLGFEENLSNQAEHIEFQNDDETFEVLDHALDIEMIAKEPTAEDKPRDRNSFAVELGGSYVSALNNMGEGYGPGVRTEFKMSDISFTVGCSAYTTFTEVSLSSFTDTDKAYIP